MTVVLIPFNLIAPVGWKLGVARGEDVAVGVGISVVVGVLLWPRGARAELRMTLVALYHAVAAVWLRCSAAGGWQQARFITSRGAPSMTPPSCAGASGWSPWA